MRQLGKLASCLWKSRALRGNPALHPVSYTHLDVYKRQVYCWLLQQDGAADWLPVNQDLHDYSRYALTDMTNLSAGADAVSYTHLENNHAAAIAQIIRESAGLRTKRDVEQWILDSKLTRDTGAVTAPVREKTVTLDIQTAREYICLLYTSRCV